MLLPPGHLAAHQASSKSRRHAAPLRINIQDIQLKGFAPGCSATSVQCLAQRDRTESPSNCNSCFESTVSSSLLAERAVEGLMRTCPAKFSTLAFVFATRWKTPTSGENAEWASVGPSGGRCSSKRFQAPRPVHSLKLQGVRGTNTQRHGTSWRTRNSES